MRRLTVSGLRTSCSVFDERRRRRGSSGGCRRTGGGPTRAAPRGSGAVPRWWRLPCRRSSGPIPPGAGRSGGDLSAGGARALDPDGATDHHPTPREMDVARPSKRPNKRNGPRGGRPPSPGPGAARARIARTERGPNALRPDGLRGEVERRPRRDGCGRGRPRSSRARPWGRSRPCRPPGCGRAARRPRTRAPATAAARALLSSVLDDHLATLFVMGWPSVCPTTATFASGWRAIAIEVALSAARRSGFVRSLSEPESKPSVNTTTTLAPSTRTWAPGTPRSSSATWLGRLLDGRAVRARPRPRPPSPPPRSAASSSAAWRFCASSAVRSVVEPGLLVRVRLRHREPARRGGRRRRAS